jgi:16S rRNA (uracil1498-N3)-methyltransferase
MHLHRFYLPPAACRGDGLRLDGPEAHHAVRVLRLNAGDKAVVQDGAGHELFCEVESASRDTLSLRVRKRNFAPPPPCALTLFIALPRGKIIESIIQKSVELGVQKIAPLLTERVVTRLDEKDASRKGEQWRQTAIEAMKQCGAPWLPEIEIPAPIESFLAQKEKPDLQMVGSLQKERRHPREIFREFQNAHDHPPASAAVWIGPEGDFTPDELHAISNAGARPISLGNLVLRVETAAIFCLSMLNYEFNISGQCE